MVAKKVSCAWYLRKSAKWPGGALDLLHQAFDDFWMRLGLGFHPLPAHADECFDIFPKCFGMRVAEVVGDVRQERRAEGGDGCGAFRGNGQEV